MIAFAWVLGSIFTYLAIGAGIAKWDMPYLHRRMRDDSDDSNWQREALAARDGSAATVFFWPFRTPWLLAARMADKANPVLIERELERRQAAIEKREREIRALERTLDVEGQ